MEFQTFEPHPDLPPLVKCYWTLTVPANADAQRQLILADGCIDMAFILGDDIKRYTAGDAFIIQPRAMILGQITEQFYIEPTGYVDTFAVRFYPFGLANFVPVPINTLANTETPLARVFPPDLSDRLAQRMIEAADTPERIKVIEEFLLDRLSESHTVDTIVRRTIDALLETKGRVAIKEIVKDDAATKRQLERTFVQKIGISAKQLGRVIRLQAALKLMLNRGPRPSPRLPTRVSTTIRRTSLRTSGNLPGLHLGGFSAPNGWRSLHSFTNSPAPVAFLRFPPSRAPYTHLAMCRRPEHQHETSVGGVQCRIRISVAS